METYLAILRGINVGGKNKIKMSDLVEKLQALNLKELKTYIQSGNVVFKHPSVPANKLADQISHLIKKEFGFDVPVIVLPLTEIQEIISKNPYVQDHTKDEKSLHVTFLDESPDLANIEKLDGYSDSPNEFAIARNAVYLFCPNGYSKTKLTNQFFERKLHVTATTRNWQTTLKLAELAVQ